jgi:uncharacterized membrane protein
VGFLHSRGKVGQRERAARGLALHVGAVVVVVVVGVVVVVFAASLQWCRRS